MLFKSEYRLRYMLTSSNYCWLLVAFQRALISLQTGSIDIVLNCFALAR